MIRSFYIWYEFTKGHKHGYWQLIWSSYLEYTLVSTTLWSNLHMIFMQTAKLLQKVKNYKLNQLLIIFVIGLLKIVLIEINFKENLILSFKTHRIYRNNSRGVRNRLQLFWPNHYFHFYFLSFCIKIVQWFTAPKWHYWHKVHFW